MPCIVKNTDQEWFMYFCAWGRPKPGGLDWAMDPGYPRRMPNFAHGTAGVAFFLTRLYERTKRAEFLDAALAAATLVSSSFMADDIFSPPDVGG